MGLLFTFLCACAITPALCQSLLDAATSESKWIVDVRRHLHRFPELGFREVKTSQIIRDYLDELGIAYKYETSLPLNEAFPSHVALCPSTRKSRLSNSYLKTFTNSEVLATRDCSDFEFCRYPVAKTGLTATIGKGRPVVALRADIDALPVHEPEGLPFVSEVLFCLSIVTCSHFVKSAHITLCDNESPSA
jgi:metal-dependent amidase/aminoacylase/carboxypeptidase family protein